MDRNQLEIIEIDGKEYYDVDEVNDLLDEAESEVNDIDNAVSKLKNMLW